MLTLVAAMVARWWFWRRVRDQGRRVECGISVGEVMEILGGSSGKAGAFRDAAALGNAVREGGLRLMEKDGVALAKRRRLGWWNLRILPALVVMLGVVSLVSKWAPVPWVLAIGALLIAGHVVVRIAGISVELEAVKRGWAELGKQVRFRRMDEEEAILRCARASVWETILPW
ncbi:hypothetical protein Hsar01_01662 [Haloferula sargassicola]|uniref:Uncharacterized protein n=1 Tax=Haloferula sargassicola TaxID=490096 RepID=A0ABP9UMI1_9BACT